LAGAIFFIFLEPEILNWLVFICFAGHESDRGALEAGRGHRGAAAAGAERVAAPRRRRRRPRQAAPQTICQGEEILHFLFSKKKKQRFNSVVGAVGGGRG